MSTTGRFTSLAVFLFCFFSPSIFPLLLDLHLFMHQGKIEIYQGARPCLCGLQGSEFWKRRLLFEATGPGSDGEVWERGRGRRTLWCAEIDNIKGSLTKNTLSGHNTSVVLCHWMVQLGWIWSRWLQIEDWFGIWFLGKLSFLWIRGQYNSGSQFIFFRFLEWTPAWFHISVSLAVEKVATHQ